MRFGGETWLLRYGNKISWLRTPDFFFLMQAGLELAVKIKLVVV